MRVTYCIGVPPARPQALVIPGDFDGAHRGHLAALRQAAKIARDERLPLVVALLWPGPSDRDGISQPCLSLLGERIELLRATGLVDETLVISHAPDTGPVTVEETLDRISEWYDPRTLLLAQDDGQTAIQEALAQGAAERGWRVTPLEHSPESERITTGSVREALTRGDVAHAAMLLGRPYAVAGMVIGGDRRGRLLGFPTANLLLDQRKALPADGIYATHARLPGEAEAQRPAVVSLGVRPQFGSGKPRLVEVYLMDASLDLYGEPLLVEFVARLRGEERFTSVEALQEQMARDVADARRALAGDERGWLASS
jgi:riboflavin kinase / FMN adenylyltransferase